MISMAEKPPTREKRRANLRDLTPRKDPCAGVGALHPEAPPLPIPPAGFVIGADRGESREQRRRNGH
jgi:hypothetical protein